MELSATEKKIVSSNMRNDLDSWLMLDY